MLATWLRAMVKRSSWPSSSSPPRSGSSSPAPELRALEGAEPAEPPAPPAPPSSALPFRKPASSGLGGSAGTWASLCSSERGRLAPRSGLPVASLSRLAETRGAGPSDASPAVTCVHSKVRRSRQFRTVQGGAATPSQHQGFCSQPGPQLHFVARMLRVQACRQQRHGADLPAAECRAAGRRGTAACWGPGARATHVGLGTPACQEQSRQHQSSSACTVRQAEATRHAPATDTLLACKCAA